MALLAQDLREAVLQAALSGKLSMQIHSDTNVNELLNRLSVEKNKTIYFLKQDKEIPKSWGIVSLGDIILKDVGGGTPSKMKPGYWNGDIPWMSVKDFSKAENGYIINTIDHITRDGLDNSSSNLIDTNAIVLCIRMGLGKYARLTRPTAINQDLRAIWISKEINEKYFFLYYSNLKIEGTGTTVKGIKKEELFSLPFPLPPIEEQQRIVERVEELMSKIDEFEKIENKLEALKKSFPEDMKASLLQAAFSGNLSNDDFNAWTSKTCKEVFELSDGEKVENVKLPYLEAKYLRGKKEATIKTEGRFVSEGEYAILVDGENSGEVFKIRENGILGSTFKILKINSDIIDQYALYFLEMNKNYLKNNKRGAAIPHLDKKLFFGLDFSYPRKEAQYDIIEKLDNIINYLD